MPRAFVPHLLVLWAWGTSGGALSGIPAMAEPTLSEPAVLPDEASAEPAAGAPPAAVEREAPFVWRWAGLEIVGQRQLERGAIALRLPIPVGEPFREELAGDLISSCDGLAATLGLLRLSCVPLRKTGEGVFLVVDVVERSEPERLIFAAAPEGDVELPAALTRAYARLEEAYTARLAAGRPVAESADAGHLDFDDPALHGWVGELLALVPPQRETLLRVLAEDRDASDRARAATLLHWAPDKPGTIAAVLRHLEDPDPAVRNDVSRFMLFYLGDVSAPRTLRAVVDSLARQLARPSHGDRNKALYGLGAVLDVHPGLAPYVKERAGAWLRRIGEQSVLSNVGGVARELLDRLPP